MFQGNNVPNWVHLRKHHCVPHLFGRKHSTDVGKHGDCCQCRFIIWADNVISAICRTLHARISWRSLTRLVGLVVADVSRRLIVEHNKNSAEGALLGEDYTPLHSPWISVGTLLASGLVMSLCNLYFQKSLTIFNSALYGGAVVATGVDYFVENSIMLMWVWDKVRAKESEDNPCWFSWAILMIWPVLLILGITIQILVAGKGIYHEEQFPRVKRPRTANPETREERKQRKYRYLYQVRTCHGDVISQPIAKKYVHQIDETCA